MPTYGTVTRLKPRVRVLRGYPGNEPKSKSLTAPVTAGVTVRSGQVISCVSGSWVLGCAAGLTPYVASADSTDTDVISAAGLLGLSCSGDYVIQTGFFTAAAGSYAGNDIPLKADSGTTVLSPVSGAGCVTLASGMNDTADIIGMTVNGGIQNVTNTNSESADNPAYMLAFNTQWLPKRT